MTKQEFIAALRAALSDIPERDAEDQIGFYSEMIDDRMEEGLTEEEAIFDVGSIEEIVSQIVSNCSLAVKDEGEAKRKLRAWEIVLLVLGSPIWISLLISAIAVAFSLYVTLWSLIISLWAVEVSLFVAALGAVVTGVFFSFNENIVAGIAMIGAGIFCVGLSIFLSFASRAVTKATVVLTKKIIFNIKKCFTKKEVA